MRALPRSSQINTSWRKVLHDEDMAAAILDRVLERGRFNHLDGPSGRTRHLNLEENTKRPRISVTHTNLILLHPCVMSIDLPSITRLIGSRSKRQKRIIRVL